MAGSCTYDGLIGQDYVAQHPSAIASAFLSALRSKREVCDIVI